MVAGRCDAQLAQLLHDDAGVGAGHVGVDQVAARFAGDAGQVHDVEHPRRGVQSLQRELRQFGGGDDPELHAGSQACR